MSANNREISVIKSTGCPYNFYSVTANGKKYLIGGVPEQYKDNYIAEAATASAIILLTSKPEFCGGIAEAVEKNPGIEIYATPAGLRNIKEIINSEINEKLIKDGMSLDGITFYAAPNLPWVDTALVMCCGTLFSGELFSGDERYYTDNLSVNRGFVASAVAKVKALDVKYICPAIGEVEDVNAKISEYEAFTQPKEKTTARISVIYSSEYGFTEQLAEYVKDMLSEEYDVYFAKAPETDIDIVNKSDAIIIGTNTVNRNAPKSVWNVITQLDLVNNRQMPYFVFGSFGWAGDGIKLIDNTLKAMGMKQASKPVDVLFKPQDKDFMRLQKSAAQLVGMLKER